MGAAFGMAFAVVLLATNMLSLRSLAAASANVTASTLIVLISGAMTFTPFVIATAIGLYGRGIAR